MTAQKPLPSGLGPFTTAQEAIGDIDLTGKLAVVTGGASGLGHEMSRVLAKAGARVIVPARSMDKAREALADIEGVELAQLDLADPAAIDAFAADLVTRESALHILINSAGVMASPLARDPRGHESQLAVNHLAPFRLTAGLAPLLKAAQGARVVSMSSRAHRLSAFDFEDPDFNARPYDPWKAYGQSKTANALFALGLDRRAAAHGVRAFSVHPGSILTGLARHLTREQVAAFGAYDDEGKPKIDPERDMKSVPQGAATAIWCATAPSLAGHGGVYCENCDIAVERSAEDPAVDGVRAWAADPVAADRLWDLSKAWEGLDGDWSPVA